MSAIISAAFLIAYGSGTSVTMVVYVMAER